MNVYWLEQAEVDVRVDDDWLSANEAASLGGIHFPKRRADWRLGRWTAKCALSVTLDLPVHSQPLRKIEIRAALSGWPQVFFCNRPLARSISLSHRAGVAACAVSMSSAELGCDLEMVEPRSEAFVADYFSIEEQALVASVSAVDRPRLLALLWSAKESTLKALRVGLRLDTRSVVVFPCAMSFDCNGWNELRVHYTSGRNAGDLPVADRLFHGWWHYADNMVRTLVAAPPPDPPIRLRIPVCVPNASFLSRRGWCLA